MKINIELFKENQVKRKYFIYVLETSIENMSKYKMLVKQISIIEASANFENRLNEIA